MTQASIEHVNIAVSSPERTAEMLAKLFDWQVRWTGPSALGGRTIHVETTTDYIALHTQNVRDGPSLAHPKARPVNHIGIEVDDLNAVESCAISIGLKPFNHDNYAPGRRFYIFDADKIEWEIVSYASRKDDER